MMAITFEFEGVRISEDAMAALRLVRDTAMVAADVARAIGAVTGGSALQRMRRLMNAGLVEAVQMPPRVPQHIHRGFITGWRCTDKGRSMLAGAKVVHGKTTGEREAPVKVAHQARRENPSDVDAYDAQVGTVEWPTYDCDAIVSSARLTQPTSVFDLPRVMRREYW